jgi:hypothetical protein
MCISLFMLCVGLQIQDHEALECGLATPHAVAFGPLQRCVQALRLHPAGLADLTCCLHILWLI